MSYLYSKLPETGVPLLIGTGGLHQVLSSLATSGARRQIGVCQDCTHFGREMCRNLPSTGPSAAECLLLGVPIPPEDVGLLCVHFQPMNEHREDRRTP